jgi:predicted PurR-regulated permease PerM|tara:strand:- start:128 stop:1273 length:1146 start_codon:yes stop_codon:yes gene_type:complete
MESTSGAPPMSNQEQFLSNILEAAIRLSVLGLLFYLCLQITSPFILVLMWAAIVAIAVYPLYLVLVPLLGNKEGLTASLMVLVTLAAFIVPVINMSGSLIGTAQSINEQITAGTLQIPPPSESVREWPLIGEKTHNAWTMASESLSDAAVQYREELISLSQSTLGIIGSFGGALFTFIFATIFAGVFLPYAKSGYALSVKLMSRLADHRGKEFADLTIQTVRSVAQGVVGVAIIQATLSGIGLVLMDVPAAALWALLVLVFAIAQLPPILVLGPIMVWVFSANETTPAVIFMIYGILVSSSDAFLKPLFLGRGMDIPMPVILIGAIGGMLFAGIIGLFIGAIILALGYSLFMIWLNDQKVPSNESAETSTATSTEALPESK